MKEIIEKRNYARKVFLEENSNNLVYQFRTAHKHFKDAEGNFQEIDTTMFFDEDKKAFVQQKASYHSEIPEYADEVIGFRNLYDGKDHIVKAKPVCNHVKGELFNNQSDGNYVEYKNAFSEGIDLRIYAYHHGLKEVVVINNKPKMLEDLVFDFEIIVDDTFQFTNKEGQAWEKSEKLSFKDKTVKLNHLNDRGSFFRVAQIWDSNFLIQPVDIELYYKKGKLYLRKTVTVDFMEKAQFPIYTDHATSYFSGAGDGYVDNRRFVNFGEPLVWGQSNWDILHDATESVSLEGSVANYTGAWIEVGPYIASNYMILERAFLPIDTSGIDDGADISSASLFLWVAQKYDGQNDSTGYVTVVQTNQASTSQLELEDYDQCGDAINNPTEGVSTGNRVDVTGVTSDDTVYTEFILNSTGRSWINKTGVSKFGLRQGLDTTDTVPNNDMNGIRLIGRSSETTSTDKDPYLEVTVSAQLTVSATSLEVKGIVIT